MTKADSNPYRLFFPLGIASAIFGILLWVLFTHQGIQFYPRQAHANIMFFAGLWSFILGFLMTAVPKMTGAFPVRNSELISNVILVFVQLVLNFRNETELAIYFFCLQILLLVIFLVRRIWIKKQIPFEGFFFLPFAFLQGFVGTIHFYYNNDYSSFYFLACEALVLNLILGLGSRLVPVISRVPNALMPDVVKSLDNKLKILSLAFLLNASFILEVMLSTRWPGILRFIIFLIFAIRYFKLFQKPGSFSIVAYGLKLGTVFLILSSLIRVLSPQVVASAHLMYIGVFLLITLMVATRVMLAHGKESTEYESKAIRMFVVVSLLVLATLTRYFAQSNIMDLLMTISIYSAVFGLLLWGHKFVKILYKKK